MKKFTWIAVALVVVALVAVFFVRWLDRNGVIEPGGVLSRSSLQNMTYQSDDTPTGWVRLSDGKFDDPAGHVWVTLLDTIAWGDLTGSGHPGAVVVLATNTGGSGVFHSLAVVADVGGRPVNVAIAQLGDRIKLNALTIKRREIFVDMVTHAPSDPMCCPTERVLRIYTFDGKAIRLKEQIPPDESPANLPD
jgi:hypothetical protein